MQYTYTETVGIINGVIAYLKKPENAAALTAKQYPVAARLAEMEALGETIGATNADQEELKVLLKNKTTELEGQLNSGWEKTSGLIDAIAGELGKVSPAGKNVLKIRSDVRRGSNGSDSPTPPSP